MILYYCSSKFSFFSRKTNQWKTHQVLNSKKKLNWLTCFVSSVHMEYDRWMEMTSIMKNIIESSKAICEMETDTVHTARRKKQKDAVRFGVFSIYEFTNTGVWPFITSCNLLSFLYPFLFCYWCCWFLLLFIQWRRADGFLKWKVKKEGI